MAIPASQLQLNQVPYASGGFTYLPVAACEAPDKSQGACVSALIDWFTAYGASSSKSSIAITINAQTGLPAGRVLDGIRSVKIDNTFVPVAVYVYFPDTGDTIVCPPNAVLIAPVFTNGQVCTVYANGFVTGQSGATRVEFFNFAQSGSVVESEDIPNIVGALVAQRTVGGGTDLSIAGVTFGPATADRILIAAFSYVDNVVPTVVTINGIAATLAVVSTSNPIGTKAYIYYVRSPTGASGNVVVTLSGAVLVGSIAIYTLYGAVALVPFDVQTSNTVVANETLLMNTITGGFGVYAASFYGGGGAGITGISWRNATQDSAGTLTGANSSVASEASALGVKDGIQQIQASCITTVFPTSVAMCGAFWLSS